MVVDPVQITSPLRAARNRSTSPSAEASLLSGKSKGGKSRENMVLHQKKYFCNWDHLFEQSKKPREKQTEWLLVVLA